MTIKITNPDGTVSYPFGKPETAEEQIKRLEKENAQLQQSVLVALKGIAELNAKAHNVDK